MVLNEMYPKTTTSIVAVTLLLTQSTLANAQSFFFGDSLHEIEVSETQSEEMDKIEDRFFDDIDSLENTIREAQKKLRKRTLDRTTALESELTPQQLKSLNQKRRAEAIERAKANAEYMNKFAEFSSAISKAENLTIFEGLPAKQSPEYQKIKNQNNTIEIDDWAFYGEPLASSSSTTESLRSSLVDYTSFLPYCGGKFCGGFHPDFCIKWETGDETFYAQICLGCAEAKFIKPNGETMFDLESVSYDTFLEFAVSHFRHLNKNPKPEHGF